jgi:two-component system LytT family sensor kinase
MKKSSSWFWPVQLGCWVIIGIINYSEQHFNTGIPVVIEVLNALGITAGGLAITSVYRYYLKKQQNKFRLRAGRFILTLLGSTMAQSLCWLLLIYLLFLPVQTKYNISTFHLLLNIVPLTALLLCWNLAYLSYHLVRQYHITEVEKWKLEADVQKASMGALRSQINPHFMFNTLNNIRALVLENPSQARRMITSFSELFRYTLQHSENKEVCVGDELNMLRQYLELIKMQYEDKLQYHLNADDAPLTATIPPMVLQLLVENAVKHGIALSRTGGEIAISITRVDEQLNLSVKNTGSLGHKNELEDSLGVGLKNIRERLAILYGSLAWLTIDEQAPYVIVTISIRKK